MSTIKTGEPDVSPDKPSHTPGVHEGNQEGSYEKEPGHLLNGKSTARRSTGVGAKREDPLLPSMPNLSPP